MRTRFLLKGGAIEFVFEVEPFFELSGVLIDGDLVPHGYQFK